MWSVGPVRWRWRGGCGRVRRRAGRWSWRWSCVEALRQRARALGGSAHVENEPGRGATLVLRVPAHPAEEVGPRNARPGLSGKTSALHDFAVRAESWNEDPSMPALALVACGAPLATRFHDVPALAVREGWDVTAVATLRRRTGSMTTPCGWQSAKPTRTRYRSATRPDRRPRPDGLLHPPGPGVGGRAWLRKRLCCIEPSTMILTRDLPAQRRSVHPQSWMANRALRRSPPDRPRKPADRRSCGQDRRRSVNATVPSRVSNTRVSG
jgi:hypothetical protein